jgi:porphobilinogen synthase
MTAMTKEGRMSASPESGGAMNDARKPVEAAARLSLLQRPRRNRKSEWARRLVRENALEVSDLIWPLFLIDGTDRREPVSSMPGVFRYSVDAAVIAVTEAAALGVPAVALFPYTDPDLRDEIASAALDPENLVCRACQAIKGGRTRHRPHYRCRARSLHEPWA